MIAASLQPAHVEAFEPQFARRTSQSDRVRAVLWLTLIFWVTNFGLLTMSAALNGYGHIAELIPIRIGEVLLGFCFCFAIHLMLRHIQTARTRLIALAMVAPITGTVFAWAAFLAEAAIYPWLNLQVLTGSGSIRTVLTWTWFFLAWAGMYLALSYSFDARQEQQRAAELRELAHAAQLRAVHSQINPHFLFNSLNSVSALMLDHNVGGADQMVTKLAQFLRMGLSADPSHKIPLSAELNLQRTYLEIEQLRYEDLKILFDVPTELLAAKVPAFILQPIVENAVKYGVTSAPPPTWIALRGWREGERLHLAVTDSGNGTAPKSGGFGIGRSNVLQRLSLIYGEGSVQLTSDRLEDGSFRVGLSFPFEAE